MPAKTDKQLRKEKVWNCVQECSQKFDKCLFVNVDNVTSKQICIMRKALRAMDSVMVMGKNVSKIESQTRLSNLMYYYRPLSGRPSLTLWIRTNHPPNLRLSR